MAEPEDVVGEDEDCVVESVGEISEGRSSGVGRKRGRTILQESINTGSESFTIGKCRRFPA